MDIEAIWANIVKNEGEIFNQIKGQAFTYTVNNRKTRIKLSTTNQSITRNLFEQAANLYPFENTVPLQHLRAPSYLFALLSDKRIVKILKKKK